MQEILNNQGENQLEDVLDAYMEAAERSLEDTMDAALYGDGTANGGKQLTGLATAVPIVTNTGIYGGIDRTTATIWQTKTYDAHTYSAAIGTQVNATTIRPLINAVMTKQSRGRQYADLLVMSPGTLRRVRCRNGRHPAQHQRDEHGQARLHVAGVYRRRKTGRDRIGRRHRK